MVLEGCLKKGVLWKWVIIGNFREDIGGWCSSTLVHHFWCLLIQISFTDQKKKKKDGWCSNDTRDTYGVELWKAIRRGWDDFKSRTFFVVDNVWTMKFLKDVCCGDPALSASFPLLLQKDAWVGLQICRRR